MASIRLLTDSPALVDTDMLVVPVFEGESIAAAVPALDAACAGEIARATASGEIRGRLYEFFVTPASGSGWKSGRVAIAGAGRASEFDGERLRKLAAAAALLARARRLRRVAFVLRGPLGGPDAAQAAAEGLVLAGFSGDQVQDR